MEYLIKPEISDMEFNQKIEEIDTLIASGINPKEAFRSQGLFKEESFKKSSVKFDCLRDKPFKLKTVNQQT